MLKARTLTIEIDRPAEDVYRFLAEPGNLASWTMVQNGRPAPSVGPNCWAFDGPRGAVIVHFTPANPFFVLDYRLQVGPQITHSSHVRVIPNGDGAVLTHTSVQQPLVTDAMFASEGEWMMSDLLVLKTLMESGSRD